MSAPIEPARDTPCPMAPACSLPAGHKVRHSLSLDRVSAVDATNVRRLIAEAERDGAA